VTPSGTIIDPQVATSDPDISYTEGSTYDYYTIGWPEAGDWELQILGVDVNSFESYSATVQVYSDLKTKVSLDKNEYNAGWPILVTANLAENGQPILDAKVTADVKLPTISTFAVQNSKYLRSTSQDFS
ncbi:MAG: hypothetical protein ACE5HX_11285, partial [bacterium]